MKKTNQESFTLLAIDSVQIKGDIYGVKYTFECDLGHKYSHTFDDEKKLRKFGNWLENLDEDTVTIDEFPKEALCKICANIN